MMLRRRSAQTGLEKVPRPHQFRHTFTDDYYAFRWLKVTSCAWLVGNHDRWWTARGQRCRISRRDSRDRLPNSKVTGYERVVGHEIPNCGTLCGAWGIS